MTQAISTSIAAGEGLIHAKLLPPSRLALQALNFKYPLKLISPAPSRTAKCLTVFMLSYGGGLVAGDTVDLKVILDDGAAICLQTQGSTKVFKRSPHSPLREWPAPTGTTTQNITATLHPNSSLIIIPDPMQPFGESAFSQRQTFRLLSPATTSLIVLDWVTEGRGARGERWKLSRFETRTELWDASECGGGGGEGKGRLMLRDAMILEGDDDKANGVDAVQEDDDDLYGGESLFCRQEGQTCFATLVIYGRKFAPLVDYIQHRYRSEPRIGAKQWDDGDDADVMDKYAAEAKAAGVMWTTSAVRGCQVVKVSGRDVEAVKNFIRVLLLEGKVNDDEASDSDEEGGCIEREFGTACLRCVEV